MPRNHAASRSFGGSTAASSNGYTASGALASMLAGVQGDAIGGAMSAGEPVML